MSEFAPICISFVISSLVSLILLGLPFYMSINPIAIVFRWIDQRIIGLLFLGLTFFVCVHLGLMDGFETLLSKVGFALGGRALSSFLRKMGFPALYICLVVKTTFLAAGPAQLHGDVGFEKYLPRKNENRSTPLERKIVTSLISRKNRREKAPFHRLAAERAMPASSTRNELLPTSLSVIAAPRASNLDRKITKEDKA